MTAWRAIARRLGVVAMLLATTLPARAQQGDVPIPPYTGFVTDDAGIIGEQRQAQLEAFLDQLKVKTGVQFAVLTVKSTAPEEPSTYKTRVFNAWGIGGAERDEGLLLLVAMEQRQARFETGYGLEGTLPDGWQSRMYRDLIRPHFRAGDYEEGIIAGVLACAQRIGAEKGVTLTWNGEELRYDSVGSGESGGRLPKWIVFATLLFVFFVVLPAVISSQRGGRRGWRRYGGWNDWGGGGGWGGGFGGGGGGFGGGGGSSFGGFGGGSSGGGGGGGSW